MFETLGRLQSCNPTSLQTLTTKRKKEKLRSSALLKTLTIISIFSYTKLVLAALDTTCSAGSFLRGGGVCTPCPQNHECPGGTENYPRKCDSGYWAAIGSTTCTICPQGWFCSGTDLPVPCGQNEYALAGSTACKTCQAGTVCKDDGSLGPCPNGSYCTQQYTLALPCPAGSACTPDGGPTPCPSGYFSSEGDTECTICPVGYKCPDVKHPPLACEIGYFSARQGATDCTVCPIGYGCADATKPPKRCEIGKYAPATGLNQCFDCPVGMTCSDPEQFPSACPTGTYSIIGDAQCHFCPPGKSCEIGSPVDCPSGFYQIGGNDQCTKCPAGFYCNDKTIKPIGCQLGYYSAPGATSCTICPAGSFCSSPDLFPALCQPSTTSVAGSVKCAGCPVGQICNTDGTKTDCAATGQITDQLGTGCIDCPAGYTCPGGQFSMMTPCRPGYYSKVGELSCTVSPAGSFMLKGESTTDPTPVVTGYFADNAFINQIKCPPGHNCKDKTGRHNVICPPGHYYTHDAGCTKCPAGKFCPLAIGGHRDVAEVNASLECPDGTWSSAGATECRLVRPGYSSAGKTSESQCGTGKYNVGGNIACIDCPKNHECPFKGETITRCPLYFYAELADGECKPCPDGKDCQDWSEQGADPVDCLAGYYSRPLDFMCVPCPAGHSCAAGSSVPTKCIGGTYADEGQGSCTACPDEFYAKEGSVYCSPVPPGYHIVNKDTVNEDIAVCPHKTFSQWGSEDCSTCPDGYLCPEMSELGTTYHHSCPKGSFCAAGVQTKCPVGQYGTMERAKDNTACVDCPAGYNCPEGAAHFELYPCPKGGYCLEGKAVTPCPESTYNDALYGASAAACKTCGIGHECQIESVDKGTVCPEGNYCPRGGTKSSFPCPAGTHGASRTGKRDVSECLPCPPGNYCPEGSAAPTKSPAGFYSPLTGLPDANSLFKCAPGFYCPNEAMTSYRGFFCEPGYVCPAGSSSAQQVKCPEGTFSDKTMLFDVNQCDICPKGFHCGEASTTTTPAGQALIVECPANKYCPYGTKTSAIPLCPKGTYAPYTRAMSLEDCLPCPPGQYCSAGAGVTACPAGHYCPEGTAVATQYPCEPGYYLDEIVTSAGPPPVTAPPAAHSKNQCKHCGWNNYCASYGSTAPTPCPAGTYNIESTTASYCKTCEAGYECSQVGVNKFPLPCSAGFYSPRGATQCYHCLAGTYCPNEGTTEDEMRANRCPAGSLCVRNVASPLIENTVSPATGDVGIAEWPDKVEAANSGYACPKFKYCPIGTRFAIDIPKGTMQHLFGQGKIEDAIAIPAGWYTVEVNTAVQKYQTTECPTGFYCPTGSYEKIPCPTGSHRDTTRGQDSDDCGLCPSGTYCPTEGTTNPTACPKGHFCPEGSALPQKCPLGTYNKVLGLYDSRDCTPCDAGFYCPFLGQEDVDKVLHKCDAGYHCIGGSARPEPTDFTTGQRCPIGGYCVQATPTPASCDPGKFGPYLGATSPSDCIDCTPGFYCKGDSAASASNKCPATYFCSGGTIDYLPDAGGVFTNAGRPQPGEYTPEGSFVALKCPQGYYSVDVGVEECTICGPGYFCDATGLATPTECPEGHYCPGLEYFQINAITYRAIPCPTGTYNDIKALTKVDDCKPCPLGKACEKEGIVDPSTLPDCAAGYFCTTLAPTRYPQTFTAGKFGPCPAGYYCGVGNSDPVPCPAGKFSNQEKATSADYCLPCPPGYICTGTAQRYPTKKCDAGFTCTTSIPADPTAAGVLTQTKCNTGSVGTYCPLGSHEQLTCPAGFYQPSEGRGDCLQCSPGKYCMTGQQENCEPGYYCP